MKAEACRDGVGPERPTHEWLNEIARGAEQSANLPRHVAKPIPLSEKASGRLAEHGHETILLVEDEPALLELTTLMLERFGYAVMAAATPGEAMRLAEEHAGEIHLLISDMVMPGMSGRDLAARLFLLRPLMKCLIVSGYSEDIIARRGVLGDGVQFLAKPFSRDDLARKVRQVLRSEPMDRSAG